MLQTQTHFFICSKYTEKGVFLISYIDTNMGGDNVLCLLWGDPHRSSIYQYAQILTKLKI